MTASATPLTTPRAIQRASPSRDEAARRNGVEDLDSVAEVYAAFPYGCHALAIVPLEARHGHEFDPLEVRHGVCRVCEADWA